MASVKNVTPRPTKEKFEIELSHDEMRSMQRAAEGLLRAKNRGHLNGYAPTSDLDKALGLLFAMTPGDPLDNVPHSELDDEFVLVVASIEH